MDSIIVWVLFLAWAGACSFYLFRIYKIARSLRLTIFSALHKYNDSTRPLVKLLYTKIFLITIIFIITLILTYFVRTSTDVGY